METIAQTGLEKSTSRSETLLNHTASTTQFWNQIESHRFGVIALLFILIPCLAGIASSSALFSDNLVLFAIAGAPAMVVETLILGLASMRSVIIASAVSCVISLLVIAITYL